jgi:hypothetical protein
MELKIQKFNKLMEQLIGILANQWLHKTMTAQHHVTSRT